MMKEFIYGLVVTCLFGCGVIYAATNGDTAVSNEVVPVRYGVALHGEPKYGPDFKHFDYVNADAPKGGKLRLGALDTFDCLNPFILRGRAAPGLGLCYDTLFIASGDEPYSVYGLIAESMEFPKDRSWVIYNLRPEARWHDGTPITAEDVAFSFRIRRDKGEPGFRFNYSSVASVEVLGPRRVRFNIKPGESSHEIPLFLSQMVVLPKHYWEKRDFAATTLEPPLTSGPYKIKSFEIGRNIVYERVKDYWAKDLPVRRGIFNFDQVEYVFFRDNTVMLEAFKTGIYDWRLEYKAKNWAKGYDCDALRDGRIVKKLFPHHHAGVAYGLVFNTRRKIFADRRVRQALNYAFDFEWTNKKLFYSAYHRLRSYFDNTDLEAKGVPQGRELEFLKKLKDKYPAYVWPEVFTKEYQPPSTPPWVGADAHKLAVRTNLLTARSLLRQSGWYVRSSDMKLVNDEFKDNHGKLKPFCFEILLVQPTFEAIVLPMARALKRLGITVTVRTVESAQYMNRVKSFDYDCIVVAWPMSLCPGNEQFDNWSSKAADTKGSSNYAGIKSPAVDEVMRYLVEADSREELRLYCHVLDRLLQWGHYMIPAWAGGADRIAFWNKLDYPKPGYVPIQGVGDVFLWWFVPEKARVLEAAEQEK